MTALWETEVKIEPLRHLWQSIELAWWLFMLEPPKSQFRNKSNWALVHSVVPQELALRPILVKIFSNDIVRNIWSEIHFLAYYCVRHRRIRNGNDRRDTNKFGRWSNKWCIKFAPSKCKMTRMSTRTQHNICHLYIMLDKALEFVNQISWVSMSTMPRTERI